MCTFVKDLGQPITNKCVQYTACDVLLFQLMFYYTLPSDYQVNLIPLNDDLA